MPVIKEFSSASVASCGGKRTARRTLRRFGNAATRQGWDDKITVRRGGNAWRLADVLVRQPGIDAAAVARELDVTPQNTQRAIAPLADAGVLEEEFTGLARNRMWQSREVLDALEDFTRSSGTSGCLIRWIPVLMYTMYIGK